MSQQVNSLNLQQLPFSFASFLVSQPCWRAATFPPSEEIMAVLESGIDKYPRFRFAIYSKRIGFSASGEQQSGAVAELESSCDAKWQAESFVRTYSTWGLEDTCFYLIDWKEQKVLASVLYVRKG